MRGCRPQIKMAATSELRDIGKEELPAGSGSLPKRLGSSGRFAS